MSIRSDTEARWVAAAVLSLAGLLASIVLGFFTAWACLSEEGKLAIYCGNAKAHSYAWHGLPLLWGLVGSAIGITLGARSRIVWPLAFALLAATIAGLVLVYLFADPPPGYGPEF